MKRALLPAVLSLALASPSQASPVALQNGTATFSQTCGGGLRPPDDSVDGIVDTAGWAVASTCSVPADSAEAEIAVWETATDIDATDLQFTLVQALGDQHLLGRFRFSYTTDDRSSFADGVDNGGDVDANWNILPAPVPSGPAGVQFDALGDGSVRVGGTIPATATFVIDYAGSFFGMTGIRLEVMEDPSLPYDGPGTQPMNGNFVLSELLLDASGTPAPPSVPTSPWLMPVLAAAVAVVAYRSLRRRSFEAA